VSFWLFVLALGGPRGQAEPVNWFFCRSVAAASAQYGGLFICVAEFMLRVMPGPKGKVLRVIVPVARARLLGDCELRRLQVVSGVSVGGSGKDLLRGVPVGAGEPFWAWTVGCLRSEFGAQGLLLAVRVGPGFDNGRGRCCATSRFSWGRSLL